MKSEQWCRDALEQCIEMNKAVPNLGIQGQIMILMEILEDESSDN